MYTCDVIVDKVHIPVLAQLNAFLYSTTDGVVMQL